MSHEMAAAVEQQAQVSEQINKQVETISLLAANNADLTSQASDQVTGVLTV